MPEEGHLCHVEEVVQGDEAGPPEVAAGVVALPPHLHPLVRLHPLPGNAGERVAPQPLQPILHTLHSSLAISNLYTYEQHHNPHLTVLRIRYNQQQLSDPFPPMQPR